MSLMAQFTVHCDGDFPGCEMKVASSQNVRWSYTIADRAGWLSIKRGDKTQDFCPVCRIELGE